MPPSSDHTRSPDPGQVSHSARDLAARVKHRATSVGFDLVGVAPAVRAPGADVLNDWLARGYAGEMGYIARRREAYDHPERVLAGVRSIVMAGVMYSGRAAQPSSPGTARVARYALGAVDYHDVLRKKLRKVADTIHQAEPEAKTRVVVDTAPLLERDFARLAGLGWFGKNTMLINKHRGSWFFLGAILTTVDLEPDAPHDTAHCGTCTRCLEACPTDAFPEAGVLDASRCISYLTIELRDAPMPVELRSGVRDWAFGCDICQEVCPWNRRETEPSFVEFEPQPALEHPSAREILALTEAEFEERFGSTPLSRPGRDVMCRNAAVVLGNSGSQEFVPDLVTALEDSSSIVRGAAAWALGQLGGATAQDALIRRQRIETDSDVREELAFALQVLTAKDSGASASQRREVDS